MKTACSVFIGWVLATQALAAAEVVQIGDRRELFVDKFLVEQMEGQVDLVLQRPEPREVVLVTDAPWEGNTCAYYTVFRDGDRLRMYYRGSHFDEKTRRTTHEEVACYAESRDGIHWEKPNLGLFEFQGSKENNIVWNGIGTHDFTPFKDTNPNCTPDAQYKAFGRGRPRGKKGLYAFQSPDGIHWSLMKDEPVITTGAFDSQNLAFWDAVRGHYVDYHRMFRNGFRDIMTATSKDFLTWTEPVFLEYPGAPQEHLYTNAILAYHRAPHILLGFPTRYLPDEGSRVEPTLMSSRDGRTFHRWLDPLIPEDAPSDRRGNRSNYMAWGLVELPNHPNELSVYATEAYYTGPDSRLRRFVYRVDGFVSLHGGPDGGRLVTKVLSFRGNRLQLNYRTSETGQVRVELQNEDGAPVPGFSLADCQPLTGDAVDRNVTWRSGSDVSSLIGKPVRVCFDVRDADVFAWKFEQTGQ